ncbi:MAG: patatin-like phospholipase family protein [Anaerolineae bacterium]|nr:patatin-like phospholipase family protein [Anaerolineae bacterium]
MAPLYILRNIALFNKLTDDDLKLIGSQLHKESYPKGAFVFREGDVGDAMYLVESGQVAVVRNDDREIVTYLGPGSFAGEISLLLAQPRTASLKIMLDAELWALRKKDFDRLLATRPSIGLEMTRELSQRLVTTTRRRRRLVSRRITALIDTADAADKHRAAQQGVKLAEALYSQWKGPVGFLPLPSAGLEVEPSFSDDVMILDNDNLDENSLAKTLSYQLDVYKHIVIQLSPLPDALSNKALDLSDTVVTIGEPPAWLLSREQQAEIWEISNSDDDLSRVARQLTNRTIGLALSSGGSRGLAHLGMLKVLQAENIPIDMVAGTSAGAWFGAFFAAGWSPERYDRFSETIKTVTKFSNWDLNIIPRTGITKGRKARDKVINRSLDGRAFEDLIIPMYIIAADIYTGDEIVFDSGPLADAIRASLSVPVLADPWYYQDRYFVDGGIVNPLPADVLRAKGADIVIASSVIQPLEKSYSGRRDRMPSIWQVVSNMFSVMEAEVVEKQIPLIDVLIHHEVTAKHNLDFEHVNELVTLGEETTRRMLPAIREVIDTPPAA